MNERVILVEQASNRAAEASVYRQALLRAAEADALMHFAPPVLAIRERMTRERLKAVLADFKGPSSTALMDNFQE